MAIVFRCPECEHKLRAAEAMAGRDCRCKCGASVMVPTVSTPAPPEVDESIRGAWRLEPRFKSGDLCEAITAWSPLCAPKPGPAARKNGPPLFVPSYGQGILVGSAGVLVVALIAAGLFFAFRSTPAEQQITGREEGPPETDTTRPHAPAEDTIKSVISPPPGTPDLPPVKTVPVVKEQPKPAPFDPDKIEVVEWWYTKDKLTVIGDDGKKESVFLDDDDVKGGLVLVAVTVRLAPRFLEGKMFVVQKNEARDTALYVPSSNDPYFASGCGTEDQSWYAPTNGKHPYAAPQEGYITQSWLFYAPLKDLQTGRTTFQITDQRAATLTLASQRPSSPK